MSQKMFLKQAEGRTVPQEDGKPWPEDGLETGMTAYVRRRLKDGDLVKASKPKKPAEAPSQKSTGGKK